MTAIASLGTKIKTSLVTTSNRIRQEYGDIDALANSIKEHGLIQKIVLHYTREPSEKIELVVGGRRLEALKRIGVETLIHGEHFLWSEEKPPLQLKAVELEENVRRKQLSWQEEVLAKQQLLEIMQSIYGEARNGQPSTMQRLGGSPSGFGVNKLAAMLGESNAATSKDLELARIITAVPVLAKAETKEAARRQAVLGVAIAKNIQAQAAAPQTPKATLWTLYEDSFISGVNSIVPGSVDVVICDPPYGAGVEGMGPNSQPILAKAFDDTKVPIPYLLAATLRVLKEDSFAFFFFDFITYSEWESCVRRVPGLVMDITPLIWVKNTVINTSPYTRYSRKYEPILVIRKGNPKLLRPSQADVIQESTITFGQNETKYYHAQKPVSLIERIIIDTTITGGSVCDFCAGSGTTGVAATRLGRRSIMFEKDPMACQIIKTRLAKP
jgi:site-specific DNA-methyltransferase (adenine-specific)